jgi:hypothetical protein
MQQIIPLPRRISERLSVLERVRPNIGDLLYGEERSRFRRKSQRGPRALARFITTCMSWIEALSYKLNPQTVMFVGYSAWLLKI